MAAIIEGKKYELIRRNKSRYRRGDGLRRVDRRRHGPGVAVRTRYDVQRNSEREVRVVKLDSVALIRRMAGKPHSLWR